ncbi:CD1247 N-terminal domain-containing protein [Anaerosinus massiliensis]|uniref:CD1247 N-terminal domain-containing protein n=1 Tax=Massilibacillus massiliensis TaxID=1806837 RepID=UPI000DA62433|nr:CD1247 N-terminal domain-containing protein [Massilibacillus massiliensis]
MTNVKERVAYLHGLTKGLNVNEQTPEGKVILNIIDVLEDMADDVQDIHSLHHDLETYVETLDEDLNDLEEDFYEDSTRYADDFVEMQCPVCHEEVSFESDILDTKDEVEVTCPHCGSVVYDNITDGDCVYEIDRDGAYNSSYTYSDNPGL